VNKMPVVTEAKTLVEALEDAKNQLGTKNIFYRQQEVTSGKVFKTTMIEITAISYPELLEEMKEYLKMIIENMNIEVNFESSINQDIFEITMYSNNNSILIGKNGQTLKALETLLRSKIQLEWGFYPKVILDVENYKEKRIASLERLAIKTAKEVRETKIDAALENMNSYERRIIHNKLANFRGVSTISEGEEPNRHVIIRAE